MPLLALPCPCGLPRVAGVTQGSPRAGGGGLERTGSLSRSFVHFADDWTTQLNVVMFKQASPWLFPRGRRGTFLPCTDLIAQVHRHGARGHPSLHTQLCTRDACNVCASNVRVDPPKTLRLDQPSSACPLTYVSLTSSSIDSSAVRSHSPSLTRVCAITQRQLAAQRGRSRGPHI